MIGPDVPIPVVGKFNCSSEVWAPKRFHLVPPTVSPSYRAAGMGWQGTSQQWSYIEDVLSYREGESGQDVLSVKDVRVIE